MISNGPDWIVNDIEIDGVSQLMIKNLAGALFSVTGVVARNKHARSNFSFYGLDVIEQESEVAVTVTYIGENPHGAPFFAGIHGHAPPQRPTVLPIALKNKLLPCDTAEISVTLDRPLQIDMLEIEDGDTSGGAADWIVNDVRIDGSSQFTYSGDVPGDMFATNAIDPFVKFHPGTRIELFVTYIGLNEEGCCFTARLLGTVLRDCLDQPPPDVRAVIQVPGQPTEEVIARCNWRAPYVPPGT